jgi:hypothetical protein
MAAAKKVFDVTSTASYVAVTDFDVDTYYSHLSVENYTDGDVYIAVGSQSFPDLICAQDTDRVFDCFNFSGTMYVKNNTGTGGRVIITVWRD